MRFLIVPRTGNYYVQNVLSRAISIKPPDFSSIARLISFFPHPSFFRIVTILLQGRFVETASGNSALFKSFGRNQTVEPSSVCQLEEFINIEIKQLLESNSRSRSTARMECMQLESFCLERSSIGFPPGTHPARNWEHSRRRCCSKNYKLSSSIVHRGRIWRRKCQGKMQN